MGYMSFIFFSRVVIFYWYISHLLDFDTTDIVSFDTKYLLEQLAGIMNTNFLFHFSCSLYASH